MSRLTRIVIQLLLSAPLLLFAPAAWMGLFSFLSALAGGDTAGMQRSLFFAGAGLALAGLLVSIVIAHPSIAAQRWRKFTVLGTLELGWLLMIWFLIQNPPKADSLADAAVSLWTLAGPAIVATWNLVLLVRLPTTKRITDR